MRIRRGLAAVLGSVMAAGAILAPQMASASAGQTITQKSATNTADVLAAQLAGAGVSISNVSYAGDDRALGGFAGMQAALGLDSGVVLSTGKVMDLPGPHQDTKESPTNTKLGGGSDADLAKLINSSMRLFDAAALEFDFVPRASTVSIDYVFGSSEYRDFVNDKYNDVFGFFVNGKNCATVNDGPVTIHTVNAGKNADLYVDNTKGARDTTLHGLTTVLTCTATVKPGETNHVKLAIADGGDDKMDSAVFIASHSFFSNTAPTASDIAFSLTQNTSVRIAFPGNDLDGDALSYSIVEEPKHGLLAKEDSGAVYTPEKDYVGADSFTYTVSDGIVVSDPYTVAITVDAPVAPVPPIREIHYTAVSDTDTPIVLVPLNEDQVASSATVRVASQAVLPVTYAIVAEPKNGLLSGTGALRTYRSAPGFTGADSFQYTSAVAGVTSVSATVTLDVVARPLPPTTSRTVPVFPPSPVKVNDGPSHLASTGSDVAPLVIVGLIVLAAGIVIVVVVAIRRRRSSSN